MKTFPEKPKLFMCDHKNRRDSKSLDTNETNLVLTVLFFRHLLDSGE